MRPVLVGLLASACLILMATSASAATPSSSITVSPAAGPVGTKIVIAGQGFAPGASLAIEWATATVSWVIAQNPPQVTGIKSLPFQDKLVTVQSDATGAFSTTVTAPADFGGKHFVQAFDSTGAAIPGQGIFNLEPSFKISPTSGPAGTPITVAATGLGNSLYATSYHVNWDNTYVGYATAITTAGSTNFTIHASGVPGPHYLDIYQGYPGPAYLNPQQGPPASETQSWFPPLIPFHTQFTITPQATSGGGLSISGSLALGSVAIVAAAVVMGGMFVMRRDKASRLAMTRATAAVVMVVLLLVVGVVVYASFVQPQTTTPAAQASYTPQASVYRPAITVPILHNATIGPRISITPTTISVGDTITVKGAGFEPNAQLPLTWATRVGSNLLGYVLTNKPLKNVTAAADGSFSFQMKVAPDLGGLHFISAGNLTRNSNATVFLQRTASLSSTQGPEGTNVVLMFYGVGWDYNTNIIAADYDNSYIGYACGFNSGGNVTITIVASGAPGMHTIDIYPSLWWGPSGPTTQQVVEYRYPLLTPQDHPELMPSFHFSYLITQGNQTKSQGLGGLALTLATGSGSAALGGLFLLAQVVSPRRTDSQARFLAGQAG